jgi:hypothetical protein
VPSSWLWRTLWFLIAIPSAWLIPKYLIDSGHHVPVGVYIAIMGGVVAVAAFRKEPGAFEKAAWIVLITLLIRAEIKNLYIADEIQARTFQRIAHGLQETSTRLEDTSNRIEQQFGEIKSRFNSVDTQNSQLRKEVGDASFQTLVRKHGKLRADIAALDDKMGTRLNVHLKRLRGIDENYSRPVRDLKKEQDAFQTEADRYEMEFNKQIKPQLVNLLAEVLSETAEDSSPDKSKLVIRYGIINADSAFGVLHIIQTLSMKLIP